MEQFEKEIEILVITSLILAISFSFLDWIKMIILMSGFMFVIGLNMLVKKVYSYNKLHLETNFELWSIYQYWLGKKDHFVNPIPMIWLSPLIGFLSKGTIWWLSVITFKCTPLPSRVAKINHPRKYEPTEFDSAMISIVGIFANIIAGIFMMVVNQPTLSQLNFYYAFAMIIPFSDLDGTKIFFHSRILWTIIAIICTTFLIIGLGM